MRMPEISICAMTDPLPLFRFHYAQSTKSRYRKSEIAAGEWTMTGIAIGPAQAGLDFVARVAGVNLDNLRDAELRARLVEALEQHGVLVFEDMEQSSEMLLELSSVFGPLKDHAMQAVSRADDEGVMANVMELDFPAEDSDLYEIEGKVLAGYIPWHYDACYTKELYRGAALRCLTIPPEGGRTGFADGIQLYRDLPGRLRDRFESLDIVYHPMLMMSLQRFGLPKNWRMVHLKPSSQAVIDAARDAPRAIHPAIWQRASGERVVHVSPWQADGIAGMEGPQGDALLEELCQELFATMKPYWHTWQPGDMLVWDNWRTIHAVSGHPPNLARCVHRASFAGDYGLGRFEDDAGGKVAVKADY